MPPKFRFTKEEITDAAVVLVREKGMESLTARELASRLGASAKPIFGQFGSMREVRASVIARASQIQSEFSRREYPKGNIRRTKR